MKTLTERLVTAMGSEDLGDLIQGVLYTVGAICGALWLVSLCL